MRKKMSKIVQIIVFIVAVTSASAGADIVELDLFTLGCPSTYDYDSPYWTSDFDLGVTFTEIFHVYIDWSGEITGGLAVDDSNPDEPFPIDVGIGAYLESPPNWRHTTRWGGAATHPDAEVFDVQSEFVYGTMPWSELFDGEGTITIEYKELVILNGTYVESGSVFLNSATLVVDGTIVPEPASILLLAMGTLCLRAKYPAHRFKP